LSCTTYAALTSNTFQFGAAVTVHASAGGASLDGGLSFDTLFVFSPFSFEANISGSVAAKYKGHHIASVGLSCDLSGPAPWHAQGKATFSILWWDVTARLSKTWGSDDAVRLAAIDPTGDFLAALNLYSNWGSGVLPRRTALESLKSLDAPG